MNINPELLNSMSNEDLALLLSQVRQISSIPFVATPKQMEFLMAPERGLDQAVLFGGAIGPGKTWALCGAAIIECQEVPDNRVLLARRTSVDFKATTLISLQQLLPKDVVWRKVEQQFNFKNGSVLMYTGLGDEKDNQKIRGLEIGFLGIDEASEIEKLAFQAAASRLRWKPAKDANRIKVRLTSNPSQGWLKEDFIDDPKPGYRYIRATLRDNPYVDESYAEEQANLFADSPQWRMAFLEGDWNAFTGQDQVISSSLIDTASKRNMNKGIPVIWGLDYARFGDDKTVLMECAGTKFTQLGEWSKLGVPELSANIAAHYRDATLKPELINVDDIGVGGGVTDTLRSLGLPVKGINVTRASEHHGNKYANMKAELWWNLRKRMSSEPIDIPNDPKLKAEVGATKFEYTSGRIFIPDKKVIKANLGRSPDKADALVLAAWDGGRSYVLFDNSNIDLPKPRSIALANDPAAKTKLGLLSALKRRQF